MGISHPSQEAGKGSWELEVLGNGSGRGWCNLRFALAEKEVRCGWGRRAVISGPGWSPALQDIQVWFPEWHFEQEQYLAGERSLPH